MVYDNMIGCSTLVCVIYIYTQYICVLVPADLSNSDPIFSEAIFYHSIHASDPTDPYSWLLPSGKLTYITMERSTIFNGWIHFRLGHFQ